MKKAITPSTYLRNLSFGKVRQLADFLDHQEAWKMIAVDIMKPSGEPRYTQFHIRRFEGSIQMGKSPTCELICDWGTTNSTVQDLVDLLVKHQYLAAASVLLPGEFMTPSTHSHPTMPIDRIAFPETSTNMKLEQIHLSSEDTNQVKKDNATGFDTYTFHELVKITSNFDDRPLSAGGNKVGEGGFGVVYLGKLNSKLVAVKKLTAMVDVSIQDLKEQFDQEIQTMARCKHENLVELLGFSNDGEQYCLIYLFMSNGSLLDRLACLNGTHPLSWHTRCNIAVGTANGIKYLHENEHVHRDIKSANILLDDNFVPKVTDFGLARATDKLSRTVMTERIVGTTAYMAPEALRGEVTIKSDIFSLGVVFLEIISGLPPVDEDRDPALLLEIKDEIEEEEKTLQEYVDKKMGDVDPDTLETMYTLASQCLHQMKNKRPNITTVQQTLVKIKSALIPDSQ
ncbi:interleukin-1 receptor-associated kinase 4 [Bombina bombina]|uniref:interleukin-1 receptor-associated kinase 4 n=1 Tax=Bombina bombina TaxID=8345 RepID=UPI00235B1DA1|nr:interleukin-1 receptor-associated kinase 4 [Bombina bombina]